MAWHGHGRSSGLVTAPGSSDMPHGNKTPTVRWMVVRIQTAPTRRCHPPGSILRRQGSITGGGATALATRASQNCQGSLLGSQNRVNQLAAGQPTNTSRSQILLIWRDMNRSSDASHSSCSSTYQPIAVDLLRLASAAWPITQDLGRYYGELETFNTASVLLQLQPHPSPVPAAQSAPLQENVGQG